MKKLIAWLLLLTLTVGLFAGCRKTEADPTEPDTTISEADIEGITAAIDYLKGFYKDDGSETPVDYERFGVVRIGGVPYEVVWTVDVSEDLIKIVVNDDGTVTIDVNENCEEDTPYVLTATITDAAGNSVSHSWNHILPKAVDMVAIVKAAYALAPGESLPYESTLRGKITQIKTPYSEEYKNITVVIEIEGAEDMPIECYRLKGEGAEDLAVGDTITVTGTLKNYNGTIEFDSGCVLVAVVPGERVQAPDDMKQIVDEAYALGANKTLPYEATLTGEIIEIGEAYDSYYGNITVTIVVEGRENYPIVCYRLKGAGCENLKVTDVITVKGYITNYVGDKGYSTIEFTAGCQLLSYTPGPGVYAPTDPAEIMRIAKALGANQKTKFEATLTGVITEVNTPYSSQYGNVSVTMDVNGTNDEIYCYRIKGTGADVIGVGDTITVKGYITNYVGDSGYGTIEFVAGSKLVSYTKGVKEEIPAYNNTVVEAPVVGTAYKFGLAQKNLAGDPWLYFNGKSANTYYLGTTEDGRKAVDVYLAAATGGYNLYFKDAAGATKYINLIQKNDDEGKLRTNISIGDSASTVYAFDAEKKTLVATFSDGQYYIGTYNEYNTLSASNVSYLSDTSFQAYLLTIEALTGPASMEEAANKLEKDYPDGYDADKKLPTSLKIRDDSFTITWKLETTNAAAVKIENGVVVENSQEQAVNYKLIATITKNGTTESTTVSFSHTVAPIPKDFVKNPVADTAYKLGMNLPEKTVLFTGSMSGKYLATADDSTKAVDVKLETVSGGYLLYFMDGETKTYIRTYETDAENSKASVELTAEKPAEVYTYDKDRNILVYTKGENSYYLGTYGTYDTISASSTYYITGDNAKNLDVTQFPARFYPENIKVEPAPIIEPEGDTLTIAEVIEFASTVPHDKYTTNKYKVTGVITEVYQTTYGNMYITDGNGNTLTVYGTYDATGTNKYGDMDVKPVAGDTITVYGIIGQYNGTPQLKNGWIVDHVPTDNPPVTEPPVSEPEGDTLSIAEAIELGASLAENEYTTKKYNVTGVITAVYQTTYGNMYITDGNGNTLTIYGTYDATGANRYDAMDIKPVAGDTVTIYGAVGNYYGDPQIKNGWIVSHVPSGEEPTPPVTTEPTPSEPSGEGSSVSISFADTSTRVSQDANSQVWQENGITVTNNKGASTTNVANYSNPARFYKNSELIIAYPGMTKIVVDSVTYADNDYAGFLVEAINAAGDSNVTASAADGDVTIIFAEPVDSLSVVLSAGQARAYEITVYSGESGGNEPDVTEPDVTEPDVSEPDVSEPDVSEPDVSEPDVTEPSEGSSVSISFADTSTRVSQDANSQVWQENGITVTNNKGASTTNVANYSNPARFYKNSELIIAYPGMTKIVVDSVTYADNDYAGFLAEAINAAGDSNVTASVADGDVTIIFAESVNSFSVVLSAGQARAYEITVYSGESGGTEPDVTEPDVTEPDVTEPDVSEPDVTEPDVSEPDVTEPSEGSSVSISFADTSTRVSQDANSQVWQENGITVTNNKGASTTNVANYSNPARFYKNSELIIAYPGMTKIVVDSVTYADNDYAGFLVEAINAAGDSNVTASAADGDVTIIFAESVNSFSVVLSAGQARAYEITVYSGESGGNEPDVTEPDVTEPDVTEPETEAPNDAAQKQIVEAAYALEAGAELAGGPHTLTGVITAVNSPYDSQWNNVTVTIQIGDLADKPIQCYRLAGTGADVIGVGDTITVSGTLTNYSGTIEFAQGCTLDSYVPVPPTGSDVVDALYQKYSVMANGTELVDTITVKGVEFDLEWSVALGSEAVSIANNAVVFNPQTTEVNYKIAAAIVGENMSATWSGTVASAAAAASARTITFDDTAKRTVFTTAQQVWVENGVTVTNDKGASSTNVANYSNPARFYKSSTVTVAYAGMTKIEWETNDYSDYATVLQSSISDANATVSVSGTIVTIEFATAVDSFSVVLSGGQVRTDSITVYTA